MKKVNAKERSEATDGESEPQGMGLYFGDVLQSWANGVQLDLRVRLAVDWLKGGLLVPDKDGRPFDLGKEHAHDVVRFALDLSTELIEQAKLRGLLVDLPEHDELSAAHRKHLRRAARAGVLSQVYGGEMVREEAPGVAVPNAGRVLG